MDFSSDANADFEGQLRTNEVVDRRMDFSSDASANSEGLPEVNRGICTPQMAEKAEPDAPPNCAVVPKVYWRVIEEAACRRWRKRQSPTRRRIVRCCLSRPAPRSAHRPSPRSPRRPPSRFPGTMPRPLRSCSAHTTTDTHTPRRTSQTAPRLSAGRSSICAASS